MQDYKISIISLPKICTWA